MAARYRFLELGEWSFSGELGVSYVHIQDVETSDVTVSDAKQLIIPLSLRASIPTTLGVLTTFETYYVNATLSAQDGATVADIESGVITSTLQLAFAMQYPLSRMLLLTLRGRMVAWAPTGVITSTATRTKSS